MTPDEVPCQLNANKNSSGHEDSQYNEDEVMRDAKTIFMYNLIKKKKPDVKVITELIKEDNIAYMMDDPLLYFLMRNKGYD